MSIKIVLDAGHGLYTKGKQTPDGIKEWTLNDDVCDLATVGFKKYGVEVLRTDHNEGQIDESLAARVAEYLAAGDVVCVISVHHNALKITWSNATGVEVYTDNNPTADDVKLANLIHTKLVQKTGLKGRGVKKAAFTVINQNKVTAVLVEGGFMDGTNDYKVITSAAGKQAYADAIVESVVEMYGLTEVPTKPQWIKDDNGWWYRHADGSYARNAWEKIGEEWFYFDGNGYAAKENTWLKLDGRWYYFNERNAAVKGLHRINGVLYYFVEKGSAELYECQLIITNPSGAIVPTIQ